jgi:hypothetical protein
MFEPGKNPQKDTFESVERKVQHKLRTISALRQLGSKNVAGHLLAPKTQNPELCQVAPRYNLDFK